MNNFIRRTLIILSLFVFAFGTSFSPVNSNVFAAPVVNGASVELSVDKFDVTPDYNIVYEWTLTKTASPTLLQLAAGGSGDVTYTVSAVKTLTSTFSLTYNVTVLNKGPGDIRVDIVTSIQNTSGSFVHVTEIVENDLTVANGATFTKKYTTSFQVVGNVFDITPFKVAVELADTVNVENIKISGTQAAINYKNTPTNVFNETLTVTDSWAGAGPWTFTDTGSFQYTRTFNAGAIGDVFVNNTVTSNALQHHNPTVLTSQAQVTVRTINSAPVANPDTFTVNEGGTKNGTLTGSDPDGQSITFFEVTGPANGSLTVNEDGTYQYIHDGSETTSDSFTFRVFDGTLYSPSATVNITVTPVNDAPTANPDSFTVNEGGTFNGTLTGSDPEDDVLTFSVVDQPLNGLLTVNANGTFTYVHDGSETVSDSFTFRVYDGQLYSTGALVRVTINSVNDAPIADPDSFTVDEGATHNGMLTGSDPEDDELTFSVVDLPANGSLTINADGTFTYIHDGSETVSDSFTFQVFDGGLYSEKALVSITVTPVNEAPVADPDAFTVDEGETHNGALTGSDPEDDELIFSVVDLPANGSLTINADGTFTYIHDGSETVSDSFTFQVFDGEFYSEKALVSITVTPVNDAPVADPDAFTVDEGATHNGALTGSDPEDDELVFSVVDLPTNGSLTINADGTFTYIHDGSETVSDSFTFQVFDGELYSKKALVTITVTPVNDAPVADPDSFTVEEGGTENGMLTGSDPEEDELTFSVVDLPANGSLIINADGTFTYIHDGSETVSDSFTFQVFDGELYSEKALVTITITEVNEAPVANPDAFTVDEGATHNGTLTGSDPEDDKLLFYVVDLPANGSLVIDGEGEFVYIHDGSETTSDSFTFRVFDGEFFSQPAQVVITVTPVNDAPVADPDAFTVDEGATHNGALTGSDPEEDELTFSVVDLPANGLLVINTDGTFTYIHDGSETVSDSFTFRVFDGELYSEKALITITVVPVNEAPVANPDAFNVDEGATHNGALTGSDPEDDDLAFSVVDLPVNGLLVINADGTFTYIHDGSETVSDSFTFRVFDGEFFSQPAQVVITVTPVNDAPVADNDAFEVDQGQEYTDQLTGSDAEGDELEFILVDGPLYGVLVLNADGTYSYTHDNSENYEDSFTFKVNDGLADSNVASVTILINATLPDANAAPIADDSEFDVDQGEEYNGMVTGSDEDDDEITFILVNGPAYGVLVFNADGTFTYTHDDSENYEDSFTFKVNDGEADSDVATVTVLINATLPDTSDNNSGYIGLGALALGLILLLFSKKKEAKN